MRKLWIAAEDVWVSNFDSQEQNFRKSEQSGGRRVRGSFLRAEVSEVLRFMISDCATSNTSSLTWSPSILGCESPPSKTSETSELVPYEMRRKQYKIYYGVQPKCSIFNKSDHNTNQLSTKVITMRIDFNLYFDNIRHICVSIYIHEGLIYSTQRLDERTQSYMRPNVV